MAIPVPTAPVEARNTIKVLLDSYKSSPPTDEEIQAINDFTDAFFECYPRFQYRRKTFGNPTHNSFERLKLTSRLFDDSKWPGSATPTFTAATDAFFGSVNPQRLNGRNIVYNPSGLTSDLLLQSGAFLRLISGGKILIRT